MQDQGMRGIVLGMENQTCETCGQPLPGKALLVAIHEAMGEDQFTASQLLVSGFPAARYWPHLGVAGKDPVKSLGRYLARVPGLQPAGKTRDGARRWEVDLEFLAVL